MNKDETYAEKLETILNLIAQGQSVQRACRAVGMGASTFFDRMSVDKGFEERYIRAREARANARFEELQEYMDKVERGELDPAAGRVIMDALRWQIAKEKPTVYGDSITMRGDKDNPIAVQALGAALDMRMAKRLESLNDADQ